MATVVDYNTCKKHVVSILQASATAYGSGTTGNAPDGTVRQFSSSDEINSAILLTDGEICTLIAKTLLHPFQTTFVQTSSALANGANLPARNGMILNVLTLNGTTNIAFTSANVNTGTDSIDLSSVADTLVPLQKVQFSTTGVLPTGISAATDYWVSKSSAYPNFSFSISYMNAYNDAVVNITGTGSGNSTIVMVYQPGTQTRYKDDIMQALNAVNVFGRNENYIYNYWFIEGDTIYTTSPYAKVVYTDYTLTSSPQSPEPYLWAIVAGALSKLMKDGGDSEMCAYYERQYQGYLQEISQNAKALPEIVQYKQQ